MRWLYDYKWRLPFRTIKTPSITRQYLSGLDVLVAPNGYAPYASMDWARKGDTHSSSGSPTAVDWSPWREGPSWPRRWG